MSDPSESAETNTVELPLASSSRHRSSLRHWAVWLAAAGTLIVGGVGWAVYWFATSSERVERTAVEQLKQMGELVLASKYSSRYSQLSPRIPNLVELTNKSWAVQMIVGAETGWDYRPNRESKAFPYQGMVSIRVTRWITKPYARAEEAHEASKHSENFFEVEVGETFPVEPPGFIQRAIVVADLTFDASSQTWLVKSTDELRGDRAYAEWKDRWLRKAGPEASGPRSSLGRE